MAVRGTQYHEADAEFHAGRLKTGSKLHLVRERGNPHDQFAVLVKQASNGANLGHVGREYSAKYSSLLDLGAITSARVKKAYRRPTGHLTIEFVVDYHDTSEDASSMQYVWHSHLERIPALYEIRHISTGRSYIGSAQDVKARAIQHERNLSRREHHNRNLQADFDQSGAKAFAFTIIKKCAQGKLRTEEANELLRRRSCGTLLYNSTNDGQGKAPIRDTPPLLAQPTQPRPINQNSSPQVPKNPSESSFFSNLLWLVGIVVGLVLFW